MKLLLLAGTAFLGLAASGSAARAVPIDFTYTGSLVTFTVPATGTYEILAFGAQGGDSGSYSPAPGVVFRGTGGRGAEIGGDFGLTAGEILQIAVGGAGMTGSRQGGGGGGGGSFVVGPGNTPLVIAGAGGGAGLNLQSGSDGGSGLTDLNGGGGGGKDGSGGSAGGRDPRPPDNIPGAGGGGGFFSAGGSDGGGAGDTFPTLTGGLGNGDGGSGGFGGGGGAGGDGFPGSFGSGGGGGGYSGGGGGSCNRRGCFAGGGGGSFDAGTSQILLAGLQTGNGEVVITELAAAVPEPASIALLGVALAGLAAVWRRCRTLTD